MQKIIKFSILVCSISMVYADNSASWQDINSTLYLGSSFVKNNTHATNTRSYDNNSYGFDAGFNYLFNNNIYWDAQVDYSFNSTPFASNWMNMSTKLGYAFNSSNVWNFIPYIDLGIGNQGVYYSDANSFNYGAGLISQLRINKNILTYLDVNYQIQSYNSANLSADFNRNVFNNTNAYRLNDGSPSDYGVALGIKYITNSNIYINPFIQMQNYTQTFNLITSYGSPQIDTNTLQYQFGINIGLVL